MKLKFDSPVLNKIAVVAICFLFMAVTFFYANEKYWIYRDQPNLVRDDGCYFERKYGYRNQPLWFISVIVTYNDKKYTTQIPVDIRDDYYHDKVNIRIYTPADPNKRVIVFRDRITIPRVWNIPIVFGILNLCGYIKLHFEAKRKTRG